ncbi:unnamed protein product [Sphagnum troendelagicum]|uniref:DUF7032 domain-containing protein n=1 Tax=Sphagnum troendelagicum TaxID=128251 RepID=A0ABP0TAJ5_9BRYO
MVLPQCSHHKWSLQESLATTIASQASLVKSFVGKWIIITPRFLQLPALLMEMARLRCLSDNTVCKDLLQGIVMTLEEAQVLAKKCTELSYGGKLQMQSNLDSLAGKLDFHLHDCQLMIKSGIMHENPLAICRVTPESTREAIRWVIRDLLSHLQIGGTECKQRALDSMIQLMSEDDKNILMVAGQGAVTVLVQLLDASQPSVRERAAAAICKLALNDSCEHQVVTEGGIAPLVRLLESGSSFAQEKAAASLQALSTGSENACAVAAHGGIPALVEICRLGTPGAQAAAAGSLRNLAAVQELRTTIVEDRAIAIIINLVSSGTPMAQENAAATLQNLAVSDDMVRWEIVKEGGIQPLLRFLDNAIDPRQQEVGMGALRNLAACAANTETLITTGFLPRLIGVLESGPVTVQHIAAASVCYMASSSETRRLFGAAGAIPPLVKLLGAKTCTAQEYAAQALASLLLVEDNRKLFMSEEWSVVGLVLLLDTRLPGVAKQFPIAALHALAGNAKCRKQMMAAGACYHLRVLADMEITGAKRLLDRLVIGKLRSIMARTLLVGWISRPDIDEVVLMCVLSRGKGLHNRFIIHPICSVTAHLGRRICSNWI